MTRKKFIHEFSDEELRRLLVDRRRASRQERLDRFRRTGRVVQLASDENLHSLENYHSGIDLGYQDTQNIKLPSRRNRILNFTLLLVEIGAVFAFMFIIFNGIELIRELNKEVAIALELPTLTPTPIIRAVVLPSGHTSPTSPGGARPNEAEIPEHLRPLVQSFANIPIPTPAPEHAIRIQIPALDVDAPVVQGIEWDQLKKGVGQVIGTANPGQKGNMVLSAHNDIYGEIFRYLDRLEPGDQFTVFTNLRPYKYTITGWEVVEPSRVDVMDKTPDATATLISCYPYLIDNMRIVVKAILES